MYARVEKSLMLAGLDPYVGFLHRDDYNYKSLVYDFIEPYRAWADKVVFTFFQEKSHPKAIQMLNYRRVYAQYRRQKTCSWKLYNKYLEEGTIRYRGRNRARATILLLDAYRFAQEILGKAADEQELDIETI